MYDHPLTWTAHLTRHIASSKALCIRSVFIALSLHQHRMCVHWTKSERKNTSENQSFIQPKLNSSITVPLDDDRCPNR